MSTCTSWSSYHSQWYCTYYDFFLKLPAAYISTVVGTFTKLIQPSEVCKQRYKIKETAIELLAPYPLPRFWQDTSCTYRPCTWLPVPNSIVVLCTTLNHAPFYLILSLKTLKPWCTHSPYSMRFPSCQISQIFITICKYWKQALPTINLAVSKCIMEPFL